MRDMFSDEVILKVLAAALMCGPEINNGVSAPRDPLDELYASLPGHMRPSATQMRSMGFFEEIRDKGMTRAWRVTEKGLQFLKSGGRDEN